MIFRPENISPLVVSGEPDVLNVTIGELVAACAASGNISNATIAEIAARNRILVDDFDILNFSFVHFIVLAIDHLSEFLSFLCL